MTDVPLLLATGPGEGPLIVLAHGAGAGMTSPFMEAFAALLADSGIGVVRFEFSYMAARGSSGKRRPPPKAETLMPEYRAAIDTVRKRWPDRPLVIGGKSMGGRIASFIADEVRDAGQCFGLVCLGYPFHSPKKPGTLRTAHLLGLRCSALIVQGERDPFGTRQEVAAMVLARSIAFHWADDGDHDLGPRGASGFTRKGNLAAAAEAVTVFVGAQCRTGGAG